MLHCVAQNVCGGACFLHGITQTCCDPFLSRAAGHGMRGWCCAVHLIQGEFPRKLLICIATTLGIDIVAVWTRPQWTRSEVFPVYSYVFRQLVNAWSVIPVYVLDHFVDVWSFPHHVLEHLVTKRCSYCQKPNTIFTKNHNCMLKDKMKNSLKFAGISQM